MGLRSSLVVLENSLDLGLIQLGHPVHMPVAILTICPCPVKLFSFSSVLFYSNHLDFAVFLCLTE